MKGIIFNVFLEMVEKENGYHTVDTIIENSNLESKGIYTSVGTYSYHEIIKLVTQYSNVTGISIPLILKNFGQYAFSVFAESYSDIMQRYSNMYEFLERLEDTINVEVLKLYPDAELPVFIVEKNDKNEMILHYKSDRKMADLAYGLLNGCIKHFKTPAELKTMTVKEDNSDVMFIIRKQ